MAFRVELWGDRYVLIHEDGEPLMVRLGPGKERVAKFVSPRMAAANAKLRRCLDSLFEIPEEPPQPVN